MISAERSSLPEALKIEVHDMIACQCLRDQAEVCEWNSEDKSDDCKQHSQGEEGEDEEERVEAVEEPVRHELLQLPFVEHNKTSHRIRTNIDSRPSTWESA